MVRIGNFQNRLGEFEENSLRVRGKRSGARQLESNLRMQQDFVRWHAGSRSYLRLRGRARQGLRRWQLAEGLRRYFAAAFIREVDAPLENSLDTNPGSASTRLTLVSWFFFDSPP